MGISMKAVAARMAAYEAVESDRVLDPALPIVARVEAYLPASAKKAMRRPHDSSVQQCMSTVAASLARETHASFIFTHAFEITLVWHAGQAKQLRHAGRTQRMCAKLASLATLRFAQAVAEPAMLEHAPTFEARIWQVPGRAEVVEVLMWRQWLSVLHSTWRAAAEVCTREEFAGLTGEQVKQIVIAREFRWEDYPREFRHGLALQRRRVERRRWAGEDLSKLPSWHVAHRNPHELVLREEFHPVELPSIVRLANAQAVVFEGAEPQIRDPLAREYLNEAVVAA